MHTLSPVPSNYMATAWATEVKTLPRELGIVLTGGEATEDETERTWCLMDTVGRKGSELISKGAMIH